MQGVWLLGVSIRRSEVDRDCKVQLRPVLITQTCPEDTLLEQANLTPSFIYNPKFASSFFKTRARTGNNMVVFNSPSFDVIQKRVLLLNFTTHTSDLKEEECVEFCFSGSNLSKGAT